MLICIFLTSLSFRQIFICRDNNNRHLFICQYQKDIFLSVQEIITMVSFNRK
nr:MAG TPA: Histone deacetylase complex subunit SAP30L BINDING [Caudoviricetes sp.]